MTPSAVPCKSTEYGSVDAATVEAVTTENHEAMRAFHANRLRQTMDEAADAAATTGLTGEALDALLADES